MSRDWLEAYLAALDTRDEREQADEGLINAYNRLADHTSALHRGAPAYGQSSAQAAPGIALNKPPALRPQGSSLPSTKVASTAEEPNLTTLASLRAELTLAQRARAASALELVTIKTRFEALQVQSGRADAAMEKVQAQRALLERRLRDRDSELREKGKMLERVQDEMIGLEMQVNVAEEERARVRGENEQLVRRLVGQARERERQRDDE